MNTRPEVQRLTWLLNTKEAAAFLAVSTRTLEGWRVTGEGPPFVRLATKAIRYRVGDLESWAASRLRQSTSDGGEKGAAR